MKKVSFVILVILCSLLANGQVSTDRGDSTNGDTSIYEYFFTNEKCAFIGGFTSLNLFINKHLVIPDGHDTGIVLVNCVIEKDGTVSNVVLNPYSRPIGDAYNQASINVVKCMSGHWIPAFNKGKPVRSRIIIPIKFK